MVEKGHSFFAVVDQLRAVAALLVVYAHLVGNFLDSHGRTWAPDDLIDELVRNPGQVMMNFGWPGVALFFFISGFVITHAASRETTPEFAVKRLLRIYPPLIATVLVVWLLTVVGIQNAGVPSEPPSIGGVIASASLANYFGWSGPVLVVVGWTLAIEVLFYLGLGLVRPLLIRHPALVPTILLGIIALLTLVSTQAPPGSPLAAVAASAAFVPLLVVGQVVYLTWRRRIPVLIGGLLGAAAWIVYVEGIRLTSPLFSDSTASFQANAVLIFFVFLTAVLLEGRIAPLKPLSLVSKRSYSLYLVHVPVGLTVVTLLVDREGWPYGLGLLVGLVATAVATELFYRVIERPSLALARRISRAINGVPASRRSRGPATAQASAVTGNDDRTSSITDLRRQS